MGWREEIRTALDEWIRIEGGAGKPPRWQRVGRAATAGGAGTFVVDVRGSDIGPDQLDGLRLAGPEVESVEADGFSVSDVVQNGSLLTVRVAEFADPVDPYLWVLRQPPTFLLEALRDGIAKLGEAPLAVALAAGRIGGRDASAPDPSGFHPAQADAYRACLGGGVRLVWGPPGTGKTTVLRYAIGDLIGRGDRVLLVSATNIAVDNVLVKVVKDQRHSPGDIVRVGPPQLREVAENPEVSLPLMVRERLTEVAERRRGVERELVAIRDRAERLAALGAGLTGFDPARYDAAVKLLRTPGKDPASVEARAAAIKMRLARAVEKQRQARAFAEEARSHVEAAELSRVYWRKVDELRREQGHLRQAVARKQAQALLADDRCQELRAELEQLAGKGAVARWRNRDRREELSGKLAKAEREAARVRAEAMTAREVADARISALEAKLTELVPNIPHTREQIVERENALWSAQTTEKAADIEVRLRRQQTEHFEQEARRVREAEELVAKADRKGWPKRHAEAERLRPLVAADKRRRPELEKRFRQVQEEYERLSRDAQGEIVRNAKLVATTLARFRTNKAVFEGPYDVVLVDEAGAASLPEVILATGRASRAAVMLGDFMQLGAVLPREFEELDRPDVKRWLLPDVFQHCGVSEPEDAARHPSCVTLVEQHRFGQAVMRLANDLAYGGMLVGGPQAREPRPEGDAEIVIVDTDGLHELARPHLTGGRSGWWPAGALLSRALVDMHGEDGEEAGVVTPYGAQAEATLEALRDIESGDGLLAEVGTAHRFQGREFPIVVFDTVESEDGRELWMALAHRQPGARKWIHDGVRLFNVAATRVRTRLYIIGSWSRISGAKPGTALACLASLVNTPGVRRLRGSDLIAPPEIRQDLLGEEGQAIAEVLSRHVTVTDIHDERDFYDVFARHLRAARSSVWIWAPWVASRVRDILPELREAVRRGVRVTVFIRDGTDRIQRKPEIRPYIADLKAVVPTVVPVNVMHQKIVVIDEHTVLLGSLNTLSQKKSREVMLTMRGAYFARRLLKHEHAEVFARPPRCGRCGGDQIEIRRYQNGWYWRCYATDCKTTASGRSDAWKRQIRLGGSHGSRLGGPDRLRSRGASPPRAGASGVSGPEGSPVSPSGRAPPTEQPPVRRAATPVAHRYVFRCTGRRGGRGLFRKTLFSRLPAGRRSCADPGTPTSSRHGRGTM